VRKNYLADTIKQVSGQLGIDKSLPFHVALADILDQSGFKDLAIEQYRRAVELEPNYGKSWYSLGVDLETYAHEYEQARLCLTKAKSLLPEDEAVSSHLLRLEDRLESYHQDWAWQIKDWLETILSPSQRVKLAK
jgi:tetratricopeptide (TPR) repeat protein